MKVIIVDDDKAVHYILTRMLSVMKDVEIAGSFTETASAHAFLAEHDVDLIFMDIHMPKETGLAFAARLRERDLTTRLVFVSSHKEYALSAFDVYAFDYITKPIDQERLRRTVGRVSEEIRLRAEARAPNGFDPGSSPVEPVSPGGSIAFICFGGLDIRTDRKEWVKWNTGKSAELFAYLLLHKGRPISRARIIEDMFGEMPRKNAETYLNTTVYQLRKLLDNYGLKECLYSDSQHYALDPGRIEADLLRFEEGSRRLNVIGEGDLQEALEIERLYTGDLFGDRAFPWARSEVERLSQLYVSFTQRVCEALLLTGDTQTAVPLLTKLSAFNELDEGTFKLYMRALASTTNKEALIRQYDHFAETLRKELGIAPSAEVKRLYGQYLAALANKE